MVIGGEVREQFGSHVPSWASTEPPMVIGGEAAATTPRSSLRSFNGAADGDRRRVGCVVGYIEDRGVASTEPPMVIGGEFLGPFLSGGVRAGFNGAADGDRRRGEREAPTRVREAGCFNGAADGDRRRACCPSGNASLPLGASTEPPMVIGGELGGKGSR